MSEWQCGVCTLFNPSSVQRCEACNTVRGETGTEDYVEILSDNDDDNGDYCVVCGLPRELNEDEVCAECVDSQSKLLEEIHHDTVMDYGSRMAPVAEDTSRDDVTIIETYYRPEQDASNQYQLACQCNYPRASLDRMVKGAYYQAVQLTEQFKAAQMKDISELTSIFRCPRCGSALMHSDVRNLLEPEQFELIDTLVSEVWVVMITVHDWLRPAADYKWVQLLYYPVVSQCLGHNRECPRHQVCQLRGAVSGPDWPQALEHFCDAVGSNLEDWLSEQ